MTDEPYRLLTEKQAAEFLGVSPGVMRNLRVSGRVSYIRLSTRLCRYRKEDLVKFIEESAVRDEPPPPPADHRYIGRVSRIGIVPFTDRRKKK